MHSSGTRSRLLFSCTYFLTLFVSVVSSAAVSPRSRGPSTTSIPSSPQEARQLTGDGDDELRPPDDKKDHRGILLQFEGRSTAKINITSPAENLGTLECVPQTGLILDYDACTSAVNQFKREYDSYYMYDLTRGDELLPNDIHVPWKYESGGCEFMIDFMSDDPSYEMLVQPKDVSSAGQNLVEECVGPDSENGEGGTLVITAPIGESATMTFSIGTPAVDSPQRTSLPHISGVSLAAIAVPTAQDGGLPVHESLPSALSAVAGASPVEPFKVRSVQDPFQVRPDFICLPLSSAYRLQYSECREAVGWFEKEFHAYSHWYLTHLVPSPYNSIPAPYVHRAGGCEFRIDYFCHDPAVVMSININKIHNDAMRLVRACVGPESDRGSGGSFEFTNVFDVTGNVSIRPYDATTTTSVSVPDSSISQLEPSLSNSSEEASTVVLVSSISPVAAALPSSISSLKKRLDPIGDEIDIVPLPQQRRQESALIDTNISIGLPKYDCDPPIFPPLDYSACRLAASSFATTFNKARAYFLVHKPPSKMVWEIECPYSIKSMGCVFTFDFDPGEATGLVPGVEPPAISGLGMALARHCVGASRVKGGGGKLTTEEDWWGDTYKAIMTLKPAVAGEVYDVDLDNMPFGWNDTILELPTANGSVVEQPNTEISS